MFKLLYVEDNDDNIYMLKTRLERKGYEVLISKDSLDGIDKAKETQPDLILMDVGLPSMDGYQATKILKASKETKNIPIIILTAHAMVTDEEKAKRAGADGFESKPVNIVNLVAKMQKLIQQI